MYQLFQDSMAICHYGHKPDIFLTMTANPNWPEIQEALLEFDDGTCQIAADCPDIAAHIFQQKMKALLDDIRGGLFVELSGNVYTIEFQECGLPHMHLLIFLKVPHKIQYVMPTRLVTAPSTTPRSSVRKLTLEMIDTLSMPG